MEWSIGTNEGRHLLQNFSDGVTIMDNSDDDGDDDEDDAGDIHLWNDGMCVSELLAIICPFIRQ